MKVIKMGNGKNSVININLQSSIPVGFSHVPGYAISAVSQDERLDTQIPPNTHEVQ